ncbi:hypothetical protein [Streptomyces sp. NPDC054804]
MKRRAHHPAVHVRNISATSLTLCALLTLTACGSAEETDERADVSRTATRAPAESATPDPQQAAKMEAIAAYGAYWQEMETLYADPTGKTANLDHYAASSALKNAESDARSTHDRGLINTGKVALTAQAVTTIDASGKVPHATVSTCLDISRWQTVNAETKKPVSLPNNRLTKYLIVSTVEKYPEGWRVTRDKPQGKRC